jgi:glycosyltransferase involved in cell wall biosynthesis
MQELVARRLDRIITGSHKSRASVQQAFRLRADQITAIHDGVDTRVYRPMELPRRPNGLLYVGNSDDRNKGARYLLEAAALLRDRGIGFHLDFVDRPGAEAAPRMVQELGLGESVTFVNQQRAAQGLGRLSEHELAQTYNAAQVMVSPSLYEGFGLPAAEAQACGTPVVATTAGAFPEVIADGETGTLVPPGDARALADAIQALLKDPQRRAAMGSAGARRIEEQFSWRACATKTAQLYEEVLSSRRRNKE